MATASLEKREKIMRRVLKVLDAVDLCLPPPLTARDIHRIVKQETGCQDPYQPIKRKYNQLALSLYPELRQQVEQSGDPFALGVRLALAANAIDAGAVPNLEERSVRGAIEATVDTMIDKGAVESLRRASAEAETILYLADNAGEIVFDRILIELMGPDKTTVAVKSKPILNDATWDDAVAAGLVNRTTMVDNGSDVPGTILTEAPQAFRRLFEQADLVIAKGQGNYETLTDVDRPVFFLLQAKCAVVAANIGCERGALIIHRIARKAGRRRVPIV